MAHSVVQTEPLEKVTECHMYQGWYWVISFVINFCVFVDVKVQEFRWLLQVVWKRLKREVSALSAFLLLSTGFFFVFLFAVCLLVHFLWAE